MDLLAILAVLILGAVALIGARMYYDGQDAAYTDPGLGVTLGDGPSPAGAPFYRFDLDGGMPFDVSRFEDDGFVVTHFTLPTGRKNAIMSPGALVELPIDPPHFAMREGGSVPSDVGPATADVLKYLGGVRVITTSNALAVVSIGAQERTVQLTAMRLAKALVRDAKDAG